MRWREIVIEGIIKGGDCLLYFTWVSSFGLSDTTEVLEAMINYRPVASVNFPEKTNHQTFLVPGQGALGSQLKKLKCIANAVATNGSGRNFPLEKEPHSQRL